MIPQNLIDECRRSGVKVHIEGKTVRLKGYPDAVHIAAERLRPHKNALIDYLSSVMLNQLEEFGIPNFVSSSDDIELITRVNNMAWEFMQADDMTFGEAISLAKEIVGNCNVAPCEAAYTDVMALWNRLKNGVRRSM